MDTLGQIIIYALLGVVIFLIAGTIGFRIPAPVRRPKSKSLADVQYRPVSAGLPLSARRWLSNENGEMATPETLVAWGCGRIASKLPILGRIWLPLSWTIYLVPGSSFIIQNRITWFGRRFIRGGEEFRDGKGMFFLGKESIDVPYLDETERSLCWLYSLWLAPGSLINSAGVFTSENEDGSLRLITKAAEKPDLEFNLNFEPVTGMLNSIQTVRKGSRSGDDYPYMASFSHTENISVAKNIPTSFIGDWDHDVYVKLKLVGLQMNQDVSEAMQTGIVDLPF